MARKLYYKIIENGKNTITDSEWEEVLRLQHWYNSEFIWTAGKLTFKMFAVFQNPGAVDIDDELLWQKITDRKKELREEKLLQNEIIRRLESEGLIVAKKGGYADGCIASGFTRVANNEWNAYLVCEFLIKASMILKESVIEVVDEGGFIKPGIILIEKGTVKVRLPEHSNQEKLKAIVENRRVFSIVDPAKYDHQPYYNTTVSDFNQLEKDEKRQIVKEWNWLGFDENYDRDGDDVQGVDLNKKVVRFETGTLLFD